MTHCRLSRVGNFIIESRLLEIHCIHGGIGDWSALFFVAMLEGQRRRGNDSELKIHRGNEMFGEHGGNTQPVFYRVLTHRITQFKSIKNNAPNGKKI